MESHKLALSILAIVAVIGIAGLVLTHTSVTAMMGAPTYEQPARHAPLFLQTSAYLENFNLCNQYLCIYPSDSVFYGETEQAQQVGIDELTGNLRCGCADGREFQVRPDLLLEGFY
jgi:hypothetical protein